MKLRIGRWRRGYDPDGEESRLGWGDERFVDKADGGTHHLLRWTAKVLLG